MIRMRFPNFFLAVLSLFSGGCSLSGDDETGSDAYIRYTAQNSTLPSDQVNALAFSGTESLFIGTDRGLTEITGVDWSHYDSSKTPLSSNYITALAVENDSILWVGTERGLVKKTASGWTAIRDISGGPAEGESITCLYFDPFGSRLFAGTTNGLLVHTNGRWERWNEETSRLIDHHVYSVTADPEGQVYVGTFDHVQFNGRLWRLNGDYWARIKFETKEMNSAFPNVLKRTPDGRLLLGTGGTTGGHLAFIENWDSWTVRSGASDVPFLNGAVSDILFSEDILWLAGANGLAVLKNEVFSTVIIESETHPNLFKCLVEDKRGNLWLGGIGTGLVRIPKSDALP